MNMGIGTWLVAIIVLIILIFLSCLLYIRLLLPEVWKTLPALYRAEIAKAQAEKEKKKKPPTS